MASEASSGSHAGFRMGYRSMRYVSGAFDRELSSRT
jgi:hypothetical protein